MKGRKNGTEGEEKSHMTGKGGDKKGGRGWERKRKIN